MSRLGKKGNNLKSAEFSDLHWVGREIIDEERGSTLPGALVLRPRLLAGIPW